MPNRHFVSPLAFMCLLAVSGIFVISTPSKLGATPVALPAHALEKLISLEVGNGGLDVADDQSVLLIAVGSNSHTLTNTPEGGKKKGRGPKKDRDNLEPTPVPEPSTLLLLGAGSLLLARKRFRRSPPA
jgi:hypothetical protein